MIILATCERCKTVINLDLNIVTRFVCPKCDFFVFKFNHPIKIKHAKSAEVREFKKGEMFNSKQKTTPFWIIVSIPISPPEIPLEKKSKSRSRTRTISLPETPVRKKQNEKNA